MELEDASRVVGCCRGRVTLPLNPIIRLDRENMEIRSRYGQQRAHKRGWALERYWWIVNQPINGQNERLEGI